jgi:hypothetical protein
MAEDRYPKRTRVLGVGGLWRSANETGVSGEFGGPQFDVNPYASSNRQKMKSGMTYGMGNTDKSVFGPSKAPKSGGDTLDFLRGNQGTPPGKALAYGVSLVQESMKKGDKKDPSEYMKLLSGSEEFRKLDADSQQKVRLGMRQWFQTQSVFNPAKAMEIKNAEEAKKNVKPNFGYGFSR